ncbi:MAG: DUF2066 domain-containing protein [Gammaproteobacteria bacterium]|nr:DUF2066 domain-containing protein [Gammaproteobacteria bacterium]
MLTHPVLRSPAATRRLIACLALLLITLAPPGVAGAVEMTSLYTAEVPLDLDDNDPRSTAYRNALVEVLLRVSGSGIFSDPELFDLLFPNPAAYVVQFRPGEDDNLWVRFDGTAIEDVLRRNGQPVWGSERPLTLIWLAVDWGQGEREIIAADDPERSDDQARTIDRNRLLRQRVLDVAERRGLPVAFPLLDTEDLARVTFPDIWGGFDELILDASRRYEANSVLIGRVRVDSSQRNRWTYHFAGEQRDWTGEPELVLNLVADVLAAEFAIGGDATLRTVELSVAGINTVEAYGSVQRILSDLNVVESFAIASVEGDRILYRVEAHGGAERLARALRLSGLVEQDRFENAPLPGDVPAAALEFFFIP